MIVMKRMHLDDDQMDTSSCSNWSVCKKTGTILIGYKTWGQEKRERPSWRESFFHFHFLDKYHRHEKRITMWIESEEGDSEWGETVTSQDGITVSKKLRGHKKQVSLSLFLQRWSVILLWIVGPDNNHKSEMEEENGDGDQVFLGGTINSLVVISSSSFMCFLIYPVILEKRM